MDNILIQTIYNGERYKVPYSEMSSWFAYIKDLSVFQLDAGNLEIAFYDKFFKYKKEMNLIQTENPNSIKIRKLLKKILKGDEKSVDELHDYLDVICNENIELKKKLRLVHTVVHTNLIEE